MGFLSWKEYEAAVFEECKRVFHLRNAEIIKNAHLVGKDSGVSRQIDVLIRQNTNGLVTTTIVECKHYSSKINVKIVDSFIGCIEDVDADNGIIVSEQGFTKAAINRAHRGKNEIEVDILSLGELQQFQSQWAFPFCGGNAFVISAPFGWIIDGTQRGFSPAVLYRRGMDFEYATKVEKEWMYLQFWSKSSDMDTIENLVKMQNESLCDRDPAALIQLSTIDGILVRKAILPSYPTPEITIMREFEEFIAFVVLFCPDCFVDRDTRKVVSMLQEAIPMRVSFR